MTNFQHKLLEWYQVYKRQLPWRETSDPYRVWLSEVILQQTRVNQGLTYYQNFIDKWPDITSLAKAQEDEVMKMWQGLGYYSRARNLLKASREIVNDFGGRFPQSVEQLKKISGIGDYTAAAIASIAFQVPVPVIDGNVYRVLSRIYGINQSIDSRQGKMLFREIATELVPSIDAGNYNQALMEFGALHCTPRNPDCISCPFNSQCYALSNNQVSQFPVKDKKKAVIERFFNYLIILNRQDDDTYVYVRKRQQNDIWKSLYEFVNFETETSTDFDSLTQLDLWQKLFTGNPCTLVNESHVYKHLLTHQRIFAKFYVVKPAKKIESPHNFDLSLISQKKLDTLAFPRLIDRYLEDNNGVPE